MEMNIEAGPDSRLTPPSEPSADLAAALRRRHREMLVVAMLVLIGAFALQVRDDQRVCPRGLADWPLPETCGSRAWFGTKCPGCGLTRSFIYLAEGDWQRSLRTHRIGWLMVLAILLQFPYRLLCLCRGGPRGSTLLAARLFGYFLIAALLGNWLYDLVISLG